MNVSSTSPAFKDDRLFAHSLSVSPTLPLIQHEQVLHSHFVRRELHHAKNGLLQMETGNKKLHLSNSQKPMTSQKAKSCVDKTLLLCV